MIEKILSVGLIIALLLYLDGLFLTRRELGIRATEDHLQDWKRIVSKAKKFTEVKNGGIVELIQHDVQGEQKSIQHVVLLLIDGLRLDFMSFHNESTIDSNPYDMCGPTPFNCWRYLHYLLTTQPQNTAFFSFRADPPTTTSQRLKGITTGTLPTFIDIGSNLNSDAVTDDNLIDQLRQHFIIRSNGDGNIAKDRRKMVVLGDDTWKSLYPHQFDDYKVYHSLNTKDIDGVDEQIFREIYHYFPSKSDDGDDRDFVMDWAVLVAHFLAIDHIGHTHSAFSPLMADHLSQFDQMLEKIVNQLPPNSLLLLFGDHGMTDEGEHGGSSEEELKSGLFLYSNVDLRGNWSDEATKHDLSNPPEMYQIDLIPAISSILQTPIPFSNVGKYVNSPFFSRLSGQGMLDILLQSSSQISKYFETYFHIPQSMFSTTVDHLDVCFDQSKTYEWSHQCLVDLQCHGLETSHHSAGNHRRNFCEALKFHMLCLVSQNFSTGESQPACSHAISTYQTVLSEIQDIVRHQWTQFNDRKIFASLVIAGLAVASMAYFSMFLNRTTQRRPPQLREVPSIETSNNHDSKYSAIARNLISSFLYFSLIFSLFSPSSNSFISEERYIVYGGLQCCLLGRLFLVLFHDTQKKRCLSQIIQLLVMLLIVRSLHFQELQNSKFAILTVCFSATFCVLYCIGSNIAKYFTIIHSKQSSIRSFSEQYLLISLSLLTVLSIVSCGISQMLSLVNDNAADTNRVTIILMMQRATLWFTLLFVFGRLIASIYLQLIDELLCGSCRSSQFVGFIHGLTRVQHCLILCLYSYGPSNASALVCLIAFPWVWEKMIPVGFEKSSIHSVCFYHFLYKTAFFATGHAMQFNALQLMAGFVGTNQFHFFYSGIGLLLNTFACQFIVFVWKESQHIVPVLALLHGISLFLTMITTFLLRRHLMMWAIFAPKMLFESFHFITFSVLFWILS